MQATSSTELIAGVDSPEIDPSIEQAYLFQIFRSMSEKFNLAHYGMMAYPDELPQLTDIELLEIIAQNVDSMEASTLLILNSNHACKQWGTTSRMEDAEYAEAFAALEVAIETRMRELDMIAEA